MPRAPKTRFVLRAGATYFGIVFAAGFLLGAVRALWLVPRIGERDAELLEMPVMLAVVVVTARYLVRSAGRRVGAGAWLLAGLCALALLLAAELAVVVLIRHLSVPEYVAGRDPLAGWAYVAMLLAFAALPWLLRRAAGDTLPHPGTGGGNMIQLDHLTIPVRDLARSRSWYTATLGLKVEFEVPAHAAVALQDSGGFTLFIEQHPTGRFEPGCVLTFRVDDVAAKCDELARQGVELEAVPQRLFWGFGAELRDPDRYLIRLWDERSMRANARLHSR